ncbi:MAG: phospholipase [Legionella sp. 40-6]|nr:phospholipase [Legionella sp.]OJY49554.1 MAG: phospholipase [Legionella sp. 40-6]
MNKLLLVLFLFFLPIHLQAENAPNLTQITQHLQQHPQGFANLEHQFLGDQVTLHLEENQSKQLSLPNGMTLTYGQIVMLAGDLFGDPRYPISSCEPKQRSICFLAQFNALAQGKDNKGCQNPLSQTKNLLSYFQNLAQQLVIWKQDGKSEPDFYKLHATEINKQSNRLTCGGSKVSEYIPFGTYLKLAEVNFDHFSPDSLKAYEAGHQTALNTAMQAYQQKKMGNNKTAQQLLELAYAQNAFANHFLSDSFAAGHLRTPRRAISEHIKLPAILQLLLANLMHDEDNRLGVNVVNAAGLSWKAYGDNYLMQSQAANHRYILIEAMQRSADAIYDTFLSGTLPKKYSELELVPQADKVGQLDQAAALFKMENGVLLKRKESRNPNNYEWTAKWSPLLTLLEFSL